MLLVKKKDDNIHMCVDYKQLNKVTINNQYPLSRINDLMDQLVLVKVLSKVNLRSRYHHI